MTRERGRPRTFDIDSALDRAVEVFWKHGFQNASMHELTEAMGLSKPSLYAAFGDKEALYLKALARYVELLVARHSAALDDEPDGRKAVAGFMRSMGKMGSDPALPGGCFIINGSADCGGTTVPPAVEQALRAALAGSESMLLSRLERTRADGQLPASAKPAELASLFATLMAGLAVMAKSGVGFAKLDAVIDAAMAAWPQAQPRAATRA